MDSPQPKLAVAQYLPVAAENAAGEVADGPWLARRSHGLRPPSVVSSGLDVLVVLIDHVTRAGIGAMLKQIPAVRRVVSCDSDQAAAESLAGRRADVLLLPCVRPGPGIERLTALAASSGTKVLVLLEDSDVADSGRLTYINADGFVLRSMLTVDVLRETIGRMIGGELPIPGVVARELLARVREQPPEPSPRPSHALLTRREQQTLELLARGYSNKQIARHMEISENGAKRYVANVLAKLNCPNRTLAVAWALKRGLLKES